MHREISEEFRVEKIRKCGKKGKNTHDRARRGEESRLAWCNAASRTSRWLHHVLDLPCRSSWRPSSLARITRDNYKRLPSCVCRHETDDPTISDISLHRDRLPPRRSDESCDVSEFVIVSFAHSSPLECTGHRCRAFVSRYCQRTFTSRDVAKFLSTQSILAYWCVLFFAETITKPSSLREERTSWSSITRVSRAPPSRPNSFFRTVSQTSERWRLCSTPRAPTRSIPENEERIQRFGGTLTSIPTARHCRNSLLPRSCSRSRESAGRYAKPVALSAANFSNHLYAFTRFVIASLYIRNYENCRNRSLAFSRFSKSDGVVFSVRSDPFF